MHPAVHHWISEGIALGAGGTWVFSAIVGSMPPYTGNNYWAKWAYAALHAIAANLDKVHIPGSSGDVAAAPKSSDQK
jgi:hypothetical protein